MFKSKDIETLKWAGLPFVSITRVGKAVEPCFWSVTSSADHGSDLAKGREYALQLLAYIRETGDTQILSLTVDALPEEAQRTGLERGFLTEIALAAANLAHRRTDLNGHFE